MNYFLLTIRKQYDFDCGPKDGGRYDLSHACSVCGSGALRIDPIKLPIVSLKDMIAITLKHEVVVPARLRDEVKTLAPLCSRTILDSKSSQAASFLELIPEITLPSFSQKTTGYITERQCPACKRDGHFNIPHVPLKLSYKIIPGDFDVAATYERFGLSRLRPDFKESNFAVPLYVVSDRVRAIFSAEPGVEFEPVSIG